MKTLIILHGWQSSKEKWQKVKESLEKSGIKVIVPDLPGFKKETELHAPWTFQEYLDWVKLFIDSQKIQGKFFLLGHSFGGALAAKYAMEEGPRLGKLFLVDAACIRGKKSGRKNALEKMSKVLKIFSAVPGYSYFRRKTYILLGSDYADVEGVLKETYLNVLKEDLTHQLHQIKNPAVIIWGEKDKATPLKRAREINEKISGSRLIVMPGVGHSPHIEAPEILSKYISENL